MHSSPQDPFQTLGVRPTASEQEVRAAYRRLVQRHHPDHNAGLPEATRKFEEILEAYAEIRKRRAADALTRVRRQRAAAEASGATSEDPGVELRIAELERELREAHEAQERARVAARRAAAQTARRASDEELGYVTTDDSFTKILSDARDEISRRLSER